MNRNNFNETFDTLLNTNISFSTFQFPFSSCSHDLLQGREKIVLTVAMIVLVYRHQLWQCV